MSVAPLHHSCRDPSAISFCGHQPHPGLWAIRPSYGLLSGKLFEDHSTGRRVAKIEVEVAAYQRCIRPFAYPNHRLTCLAVSSSFRLCCTFFSSRLSVTFACRSVFFVVVSRANRSSIGRPKNDIIGSRTQQPRCEESNMYPWSPSLDVVHCCEAY